MNKKVLIFIFSLAVLIVAVLGILFSGIFTSAYTKTISIRGYEISVPDTWSTDSKGNFYNDKGEQAGKFILIDEPVTEDNATDYSGEEIKGEIARELDDVVKYTFTTGKGETNMYFMPTPENPEPYGAAVLIYTDVVKERIGEKIAKTFKKPKLGQNPPRKNIEPPNEKDTVIKIEFEDGSVSVKNSSFFTKFSESINSKENYGINVVTYKEDVKKLRLADWKYIECDGGECYMYTYYEKGDGLYTYDNNATSFSELSKIINEEKSTTSYMLKTEGEEVKLIEFPLNRYRDNADELISLKTDNAKRADIQKILEKILSSNDLKGMSFSIENDVLTITFGNDTLPNRNAAFSHSAVIFSLAKNINTVNFKYYNDEYTFTRSEVDNNSKKADSAADSEESFVEYTEELEKTNINDGEIVYSGTVTVSYNTIVTHPRTGERVEIGPYAEERGFGYLLGKPVSCVIKRKGTGYIASASSGGKVVMTYPLEDEAKLQWAINMINAYS